jgi:hypothetical protein
MEVGEGLGQNMWIQTLKLVSKALWGGSSTGAIRFPLRLGPLGTGIRAATPAALAYFTMNMPYGKPTYLRIHNV